MQLLPLQVFVVRQHWVFDCMKKELSNIHFLWCYWASTIKSSEMNASGTSWWRGGGGWKRIGQKKGNHWPTRTRRDMCEPFGCLALWLEKGPKQRRAVDGMYPGESARCSHVWLIYWEVFWTLLGWSDKSKATKRNEGASLTKQRLRNALYSTHTGFIFSSYVAVRTVYADLRDLLNPHYHVLMNRSCDNKDLLN